MNRDRMNSAMQGWMASQKKQEVITGQLVVEEGKVSLQREDGSLVELSKSDRIEVMNGNRFEPAPYSRIIEKVDSAGWPIYAGLYASVERPVKKVDIRTALWNEISDTCEEIYEGIIGDVDGAIKIQDAVEGYLNACCIERVQIHANSQAALAESQCRVQNLSHPRNEDMNMKQCGNEQVHLEPGAVVFIDDREKAAKNERPVLLGSNCSIRLDSQIKKGGTTMFSFFKNKRVSELEKRVSALESERDRLVNKADSIIEMLQDEFNEKFKKLEEK
ncbi:hypothetical protein M5X00_17310 [Paenibacillus alvei]|uniref:hypothetical protein n=1 Tax=Paenibacillus alvei TaxID=44250 RepID=UPI000288A0C0|nr:hypothetical protein [Paenibacillus alvei]EJW19187.1 hypothetical protein PAV_1c01580 [Paenibacillus alvei DSM 29]MCY9544224.1 hypothetical protein [Paenibacillus alvei]MCY9706350.1 hypothetical protein [Paenibacillus alvei]MCY9732214.1 hypothetical protein [Paenibacillus alvei]MCY9755998.1 hypothetical protein [Paenibacillus alvei]